jgi:DNA/RNA endonuclease YhcR with UshA esterase domain
MNSRRASLFAVALLIAPAAARAHHGTAGYDLTQLVTVQGTVTGYEFVQPHVEIYLDVKDGNGNIEKWLGESNTPNILARGGWSRNSLKPGDKITMVGYRAKSGAKNLRLDKVILPNGQELNSHWGGVY